MDRAIHIAQQVPAATAAINMFSFVIAGVLAAIPSLRYYRAIEKPPGKVANRVL